MDRCMDGSGRPENEAADTHYDEDLYGWATRQAALLRAGRLAEIDAVRIAEELDDVGSAQYDKLQSALTVLFLHLLKWDHQSQRRSRSWEATIREQRRRVERVLRKNPGLKSRLAEAMTEGYEDGRDRASAETGLPLHAFPEACPYDRAALMERELSLDDVR